MCRTGFQRTVGKNRRMIWFEFWTGRNRQRILVVEWIPFPAKCVPGGVFSSFVFSLCFSMSRSLVLAAVYLVSVNRIYSCTLPPHHPWPRAEPNSLLLHPPRVEAAKLNRHLIPGIVQLLLQRVVRFVFSRYDDRLSEFRCIGFDDYDQIPNHILWETAYRNTKNYGSNSRPVPDPLTHGSNLEERRDPVRWIGIRRN